MILCLMQATISVSYTHLDVYKRQVVDYRTPMGMLAIGIGGLSTALWGTIIAVRYKKYSTKKILKDFFAIKQNRGSYLFAIVFLFLDFCYVAFDGELAFNTWYIPCLLYTSHWLQQPSGRLYRSPSSH